MSFFQNLINQKEIEKHDSRPLWRYFLTDEDYNKLIEHFKFNTLYTLDPRDATLFYAEWWKRNYNGGKPSKNEIFESLVGNIKYRLTPDEFYKKAKKGASMLGIKWLRKQNTLYFRTLLLQGGLPLKHIDENQGLYKEFLLAVLDEQPDSIEDFIFKPHITNLLPKSSQNEIIYENCLEIVKSILNDGENSQYDKLLNSNDFLEDIYGELKIRKCNLTPRVRKSKPKIFWYLKKKQNRLKIYLNIGFAEFYKGESLAQILGLDDVGEREYQFYVNDDLICIFRKMINGKYKTDWKSKNDIKWNGDVSFPETYIIANGEKKEAKDFLQIMPDLKIPTLWSKISDDIWRLEKTNGVSTHEASILFPEQWNTEKKYETVEIDSTQINWANFDGEIILKYENERRTYLSNVSSFDWTIVSQKPLWMIGANMPVVRDEIKVLVYNDDNQLVQSKDYKVWIRVDNHRDNWELLNPNTNLPVGCIHIKILKDEVVAYDKIYNIGHLQIDFCDQQISSAQITTRNADLLDVALKESDLVKIESEKKGLRVRLNLDSLKIPKGVNGSICNGKQSKLHFEMLSPFEGISIVNANGDILNEQSKISFNTLYSLRILSPVKKEIEIILKNKLKPNVIISRVLKESPQPLIQFKDVMNKLYHLADVMDYENTLKLEIRENRNIKKYEVTAFDFYLNYEDKLSNRIRISENQDEKVELFAIPLNCKSSQIELIPLIEKEDIFEIPNTEFTKQFIVISSKSNDKRAMPRYFNFDDNSINRNISIDKYERIEQYHKELQNSTFDDEIWKITLAYFNICAENDIPFSTFDQIRSISRSSEVAARAFFRLTEPDYLTYDTYKNKFLQELYPKLESDLGICFHWISKHDWHSALEEINKACGYMYFEHFFELLNSYFLENNMAGALHYINGSRLNSLTVNNSDVRNLRSNLGERVLKMLPQKSPITKNDYNIPLEQHKPVRMLIQAPIAVAESIIGVPKEYPIWGGDEIRESIRRNIQYAQDLNRDFYNKVLLSTLSKN